MNGKGDKRRPMKVSSKEYSSNWDLIFKKKKPANLSFSERNLKEGGQGNKRWKTTVGVLYHPEDPGCGKKRVEIGGRKGPEPTRYNDWEKSGRCIDF